MRTPLEKRRRTAMEPAKLAGYGLPLVLLTFLGLAEGGYEPAVYQLVGAGCVWLLLLGLIAGSWTPTVPTRAAATALALIGAMVVWTLLAMLWSESAGRTGQEVARLLTYGAVFLLALQLQGTGAGATRRTLTGVAAAIGLIAVVALISRMQPGLFGANDLAEQLPEVRSRLAFPLGYWNALAALVAMGLPLVVWLASTDDRPPVRIAAAALLPVLPLVLFLTLSRTGVAAAALGTIVLVALYPARLALVPALSGGLVGGTVLIWVASNQGALLDGLEDASASSQGDRLMLVVVAVTAVSGLANWLLSRAILSDGIDGVRRLPRRPTRVSLGAAAVALVAIALVAGAPDRLSDGFDQFREPVAPADDSSRLTSASSNGRWQYWSAAVSAGLESPMLGIGAGTFEFYWQREGELSGFIRDAHSLFAEVFAELGLPGLVIFVLLLGLVPAAGIRNALSAGSGQRAMLAGGTGAAAAFILAAAGDWNWEMPVVALAFLIIAAAVLGWRSADDRGAAIVFGRRGKALTAAGLTIAFLAVALPYLSGEAIRESESRFRAADFVGAAEAAGSAASLQPYAAEPRLQEALSYEAQGRGDEAIEAAEEAIDREQTNWENWYVLARLQASVGEREQAAEAFAEARRLNPYSAVLDRAEPEFRIREP